MGYREGADLVLGFKYPFQHFNRIKNHFPVSNPIVTLFDAVAGMIAHDTDDDKLWHFCGQSPGYDEILQAAFSYNTDVVFNALLLHGDFETEAYIRRATILWNDCFDHGVGAFKYGWTWDITSLNTQGAGTNTIDTNPSHITLTTQNNAIGDNEGTRSDFVIIERARQNRSEFGVSLGQTVNTQFFCGWNDSGTNSMNPAVDKYVIVFFDESDDPNWQIKVGNGAAEDVFTSAIPADTSDIIHEIWVETDGTVHWSVNGTELDITGSVTKVMQADDHYLIVGQAQSVTGAAVIVAEIDWVENEKTKAH